mmetsp:Transcript_38387/g.118505  ORF Transcript_38387/g.118505 Transcript_38387/m.118505 type:complete len:210 (+) Transcript_38387:265-894(+)
MGMPSLGTLSASPGTSGDSLSSRTSSRRRRPSRHILEIPAASSRRPLCQRVSPGLQSSRSWLPSGSATSPPWMSRARKPWWRSTPRSSSRARTGTSSRTGNSRSTPTRGTSSPPSPTSTRPRSAPSCSACGGAPDSWRPRATRASALPRSWLRAASCLRGRAAFRAWRRSPWAARCCSLRRGAPWTWTTPRQRSRARWRPSLSAPSWSP